MTCSYCLLLFMSVSAGHLCPNWLYFLMSCLAFLLIVLHSSASSIRCLSSPYSTISRCFIIRAGFYDDIVDFSGLLIAALFDNVCDGFSHGVDAV